MSVIACQHCGRRMPDFPIASGSADASDWMVLRTCRDCAQFGHSELKRLLRIVCRCRMAGKPTEAESRWLNQKELRLFYIQTLLYSSIAR